MYLATGTRRSFDDSRVERQVTGSGRNEREDSFFRPRVGFEDLACTFSMEPLAGCDILGIGGELSGSSEVEICALTTFLEMLPTASTITPAPFQ